MTSPPADLLAFRATVQHATGLTDPADVGIVGDGAHQRTGGYHEGRDVLVAIGAFHPSALAGDTREDYSVRLVRDRAGLTDDASAMDIGAQWPNGGRAAWLRFNNLLVTDLWANRPELGCIRAVNYSPDGTRRLRTDRQHAWVIESSSDSVDIHTHIEWYRDTVGQRQACFTRLGVLIQAAVNNTPVSSSRVGDRMIVMAHERGSNVDWIGDGVFRYQCPDANHRANALVVMGLQGNPNPQSVEFNPGTLDALGPIVVSVDKGVPVQVAATFSDAAVQLLVDKLATALGGKLDVILGRLTQAGRGLSEDPHTL